MVLLNGPVHLFCLMGRCRNVCVWFMARNCRFPKVGTHGCQRGNHRLPLQGTAGLLFFLQSPLGFRQVDPHAPLACKMFHYRGGPHMRSLISIDFPAPKMEPESAHAGISCLRSLAPMWRLRCSTTQATYNTRIKVFPLD